MDEKRPSGRKSSFMHKNAIDIAIINVQMMSNSVIFTNFAVQSYTFIIKHYQFKH